MGVRLISQLYHELSNRFTFPLQEKKLSKWVCRWDPFIDIPFSINLFRSSNWMEHSQKESYTLLMVCEIFVQTRQYQCSFSGPGSFWGQTPPQGAAWLVHQQTKVRNLRHCLLQGRSSCKWPHCSGPHFGCCTWRRQLRSRIGES